MKRVLITGGSGFVGRKLVCELLDRGDHVTVLTRDATSTRRKLPSAVRVTAWDPTQSGPWVEELSVVDAVVHLAGEPAGKRWSPAAKRAIEESRITSTRVLVDAIGKAKHKPKVFVCASAIGYYGPHKGDEVLTEEAEPATDFLATVVTRWEEAARGVEEHGVRSVQLRIGIVLGEGGGPLEKMILPFKLYMGGPIGDGKQVMSWVHRDDVTGMILFALDNEEAKGPINAVSPNAATADELAKAMGIVMNRPSWLRVPKAIVEAAMGEAAVIATTGQRVYPKRAIELGYEFRYARLLPALESILGDK